MSQLSGSARLREKLLRIGQDNPNIRRGRVRGREQVREQESKEREADQKRNSLVGSTSKWEWLCLDFFAGFLVPVVQIFAYIWLYFRWEPFVVILIREPEYVLSDGDTLPFFPVSQAITFTIVLLVINVVLQFVMCFANHDRKIDAIHFEGRMTNEQPISKRFGNRIYESLFDSTSAKLCRRIFLFLAGCCTFFGFVGHREFLPATIPAWMWIGLVVAAYVVGRTRQAN